MLNFVAGFAAAQDTLQVRVESYNGVLFADGVDLGKKLNSEFKLEAGGEVLKFGKTAWTINNKFAIGDTATFLLQSEVKNKIAEKISFWLPLPSSLSVISQVFGKSFELDTTGKAGNTVKIISRPLKDLWSVRFESKGNGELIEINLAKPIKAESFYMHPNYILRMNGVVIDSAMFADIQKQSSMINRVVPIQDAQSAQLTVTLKDNCEGAELVKKDNGKTLQIVLRKKPIKAAEQAAKTTPASEVKNSSSKKIKTIVIDPGHGGKDPGAIGYKSLQEKAVVLAVGLKLKKKLEDKGFTVKMTRSSDEFIELARRPKMASEWGGDLFISLHCNAIEGKEKQKTTDGFKFYILREGNSSDDKAVARRENQAIALESGKKGKSEISAVEWIVLENQLNLYARESERLAGHLIENFDGGSVKKLQSGAGQAGFMVLVGAYMPAVLAELGFITSPKDGEFMGTEKGQNELADNLVKAIIGFAK
ncbi:hypothetical protein AGMMS49938_18010 [Fibrobacterales bacterium]|nr:hypothetical protein AGMMS49938_18010 [Fibrobacterales bacterium]